MRHPLRTALSALAAGALVTGIVAPAGAGQRITPESFGIHSFDSKPQVPGGSLRMNMSPPWYVLQNKGPGKYNWAAMDAKLAQVAGGISDRLYVFGGTPKWAAGPVQWPDRELVPGSTAAPKNMAIWRTFVTAFVKRYASQFDSYQAWNEITSPQFYQGTAAQMATMTAILNEVVNRWDPSAEVVSASVQTHAQAYYDRMALPYFREMKKVGWPVDAVAGHFYPPGKGGPDQRIKQIRMFQRDVKANGGRGIPQWDTEANFETTVPGGSQRGRITGKKAAAYVARNYLDTWRTGLTRSYWYLWSLNYVAFPGIQMRPGDIGTKAFTTMVGWTSGAKFTKCKGNRLVTCTFKKGGRFQIVFTTSGKSTYRFSGKKSVCPATGASCSTRKKSTKVTTLPLRIA